MADSVFSTSLVNAALTHLGQSHLTGLSEHAGAQVMYPLVRDKLLSWARWRFATTRQLLARLSVAPASEYAYQYALPTQPYCLRILDVDCASYPYAREVYIDPLTPEVAQGVILTDASSVVLRYIARVSEAVWPPLVADTCALWLACAISQEVTGRAALRAQLFAELQAQLSRAILLEGHQDTPRRLTLNETYLVARDVEVVPRVDPSLPTP